MIFKNGLQEWSFALRSKPAIAQGCDGGSGGLGFFCGLVMCEATFSRKGPASPEFGVNGGQASFDAINDLDFGV
jgi:hypothetical protein